MQRQGSDEGTQSSLSMTHPGLRPSGAKAGGSQTLPSPCAIAQQGPLKTRKSEGWLGFMWTTAWVLQETGPGRPALSQPRVGKDSVWFDLTTSPKQPVAIGQSEINNGTPPTSGDSQSNGQHTGNKPLNAIFDRAMG